MFDFDFTYSKAQNEIFFQSSEKYIIVTKGRRFGATKGASQAFIEYMIEGITPLLWVDTINGNIDRYFERYFEPSLKKSKIEYNFNKQKKELKILSSTLDFRSADNPHNIEGFGYKKIFLNEAGIILADNYLYTNAILPMMLDFSDSQLIAAGVPKGKIKKTGEEHTFYTLYKRGKEGDNNYKVLEYTSYDSPFLKEQDIEELKREMSAMNAQMIDQEIYGQFIDYENNNNPFLYNFKELKYDNTLAYDPAKQLLISMDFNVNPMTAIFAHSYMIGREEHLDIFDEVAIVESDPQKMADYIYTNYYKSLPTIKITGDAMGLKKDIGQRDNASLYEQIKRKLNLRNSQILAKSNPTQENSRTDCNYFVVNFNNLKLHPDKCKNLIFDFKNVQCDRFGAIMKANRNDISQRGDFLDCYRYLVNSFFKDWILKDMKYGKAA